jgi:hypothetical protein
MLHHFAASSAQNRLRPSLMLIGNQAQNMYCKISGGIGA